MLVVVFFTIAPVFASNPPNRSDYPRMDKMYQIICDSETVIMSQATAKLMDTAWDVRVASDVATLQGYGWKVSAVMGYGFHTIVMQSRDVCPTWSGTEMAYYNRVPGTPLFPMNISAFRFALHLIVGGEVKQQIISEVFGWTSVAIDTCPTPAAGSAWIAPIASVHDEAQALSILNSVGFYNDTAHTGLANGVWANTNAGIGPVGEIRSTAGFLGTPFERNIRCLTNTAAALSTSLVTEKFMVRWNKFFGLNSLGNPYFVEDLFGIDDFWSVVDDMDFDMEGMGWVVGKDPDYLYDFFNGDVDMYMGSNHAGINDVDLNRLTQELKSTAWPNGTIITDMATLQDICKQAQYYVYYLSPYLVNRAAITPCLYAVSVSGMNKVHDWLEPLGYTSETGWTYDFIMVDTSGAGPSTVRMCNPGTPKTLNPIKASLVYEWNILSRLYDGFITIDPYSKADVNWACSSNKIVEWTDPSINAHGLNMTFKIRHGITWHNGDKFNSTDAKWSLDFICSIKPGRYINLWSNMYLATAGYKGDEYALNVLFNNTGLWYKYEVAGDAMIFNKKVWNWLWGNSADAQLWQLWTVNYDAHTGESGHGDLTCLIGTGDWVFVTWNQPGLYALEMANRPFTLTSSPTWTYTGQYWAPFLREDVNFDGKCDGKDIAFIVKAFGAYPGHARWVYGQYDIYQDWKIDGKDMAYEIKKYGKATLPYP